MGPQPVKSTRPWIVVVLLFFAAAINYIDRGSLSIAAPSLITEFSMSPVQMGFPLSDRKSVV